MRALSTALRTNAYALLPQRVEAGPIVDFLATCPTHGGPHVRTDAHGYQGYKPEDVLRAPALLELFNHGHVLDLVEEFLGFAPCLYSVNAWWSLPGNHPKLWHSQLFHRDIDEARFLCLFVYLTDVRSHDDGPHQICPESLTDGVIGCGEAFDAMVEKAFDVETILGRAGTIFLADTRALHRGLVPKSKPRLMAWARYGSGPNKNSADLEMEPISLPGRLEDTPRTRSVNRLLVKFNG